MPARLSATDGRPGHAKLVLAILMVLFAPCAGCGLMEKHQNRKIPSYGTYDPTSPRELTKVALPAYVIEPPDELEIAVRPDMLDIPTRTYTVRQDGVVDLGFYGEARVAGLTVRDAELEITRQIAATTTVPDIKDPIQVSVRLLDGARSKQYYVLGTVNAPGAYPIKGNETVLDAILMGGLKSNSLPDKAYLARPHPEGGPEQVLRIDWEAIKLGDTQTNYQLMPGDRVVVPGGRAPGLLRTLLGG